MYKKDEKTNINQYNYIESLNYNKMNIKEFIEIHKIIVPENNYLIKDVPNEKSEPIEKTETEVSICYNDLLTLNYKIMLLEKKNTILILNQNQTIQSNHIFRLILVQNNNSNYINAHMDDVMDFLIKINKILDSNQLNYCTICSEELIVKGTGNITHCENICCKKKFYHLVTDNRVTGSFNKDYEVFIFLVNILVLGQSHHKGQLAYNPLPFVDSIDNLEQLKNITPSELNFSNNTNIEKLIEKIKNSENDLELYDKIGHITYCLLKNAVSNNYFSMSSRENVIKNNSVIFIHMNYSAEVENKFQNNYYLFHGSSIYSWYPIVKNGLKVMSGTALQANGAAYGHGIYFSDSFTMSLRYSRMGANGITAVGVFEISKDPAQFKKITNIFVIPDDTILLLRSLVIVKNGASVSKDITDYFTRELPLQKKTNKLSLGMLKNKRLSIEYEKLSSLPHINKIEIISQFEWIITFEQIKNNSISIELKFSNYPICPPDIKLQSEKIKISGLVDSNNLIKLDLTNPANWKITSNLTDITTKLYNCFTESIN